MCALFDPIICGLFVYVPGDCGTTVRANSDRWIEAQEILSSTGDRSRLVSERRPTGAGGRRSGPRPNRSRFRRTRSQVFAADRGKPAVPREGATGGNEEKGVVVGWEREREVTIWRVICMSLCAWPIRGYVEFKSRNSRVWHTSAAVYIGKKHLTCAYL